MSSFHRVTKRHNKCLHPFMISDVCHTVNEFRERLGNKRKNNNFYASVSRLFSFAKQQHSLTGK